jgi:hypothetical protein
MAQSLSELFPTISVADPQGVPELQVFGLRWGSEARLDYATMDEALKAKTLKITEVNAAGQVPTLQVVNRADRRVFLMAGEQVVGAKQNRVLNVSLMIAPKSELLVPVSCVEAHRWHTHSGSLKFSSNQTSSHGVLRKMMSGHAAEGYRQGGSPSSVQREVWQEVSRKLDAMGSVSPSAALAQAYEDHQGRLAELLARFPVPHDCEGAAYAVAGRLAGLDLFDQPATLAKFWPKLIRSYALDALEPADPAPLVTTGSVTEWVRTVHRAKVESFRSPGLGLDLRLSGAGYLGAALVVDEHPIHLELFPVDQPAGPGGSSDQPEEAR